MELLLNQVHGQALRQVPVGSGPEPITPGEKRLLGRRGAVSALRIERGRVYWADEKGFRSWTGAQAWRKLPLAE
jgi:hypothetical protein